MIAPFPCHQTSVPVCSVECAFITASLPECECICVCALGIFVLSLFVVHRVSVPLQFCVWFGFGFGL